MNWLFHPSSRLRRAHVERAPPSAPAWWRLLRAALLTAFGVELLYVIFAAVFLNFNLLPLAFASTNQVLATVGSGWSVIPGRLHVRNVRVTFQDHNVQFSIDLAQGFLVLSLRELAQRTFHATQLRGDGVVFRMRNRIDPWDQHEPWVGALPPIPEFAAPAVYEAYVPEPPIPDAAYKLWKIHFDDVDVGATELWAQHFRYKGHARARGKFQLRPARELWVGPSTLDLEPGLLSAGVYRVAPGLHGHIACTVHAFDVRPVRGLEPLRFIDARVMLDAPLLDPQVYALFAGEPAPKVSSESGLVHVDLETRRGVLTPASRVDIVQSGFELRAGQGDLDAGRLELHAAADDPMGSRVTLFIDRGTFKEPIAPGYPPSIAHLDLSIFSGNRDVTRAFDFKEARLTEARVTLSDATWLNRWLKGRNFALTGGGASLLARGRYADSLLDGEAVLESNGLAAVLTGKRLRYAGALAIRAEGASLQRFTGKVVADLSGRSMWLELARGQLELEGLQAHVFARRDDQGSALHGQAKLWNMNTHAGGFEVHAPAVDALAHSEPGADGAQLTQIRADIPALRIESRAGRLTTAAVLRGTLAQPKNSPTQNLELWATLLAPRALLEGNPKTTAVTPRVALHAALSRAASGALNGKLDLAPAPWRVDSGHVRVSGRSALLARFADFDLERNSGQVDAHVTSTGVTLGDTTQNADCPWSRVQALTLDGTARLLERGGASLTLDGTASQSELQWGDFLTRADVSWSGRFEPGLSDRDGEGSIAIALTNASLRSGAGGAAGWAASVPALHLNASLSQRAGKLSGAATLLATDAQGRIGATKLSTDLTVDLKLDALDLVARTAHASGAVHVRNAALPNAPDPVSKWWADIRLDTLYGHAEKNLELGGSFRANLRDATPGLAVLASQGSLPKWVASAFPLRGLSMTGSLARRCRLTDIHVVQLSGGPALARGRLQSLPDGFQGALLLRLSGLEAVSAGLDFDEKHTHFALFEGDAWLERFERYFDRKSDAAVKLSCPPDPNRCTEPEAVSRVSDVRK